MKSKLWILVGIVLCVLVYVYATFGTDSFTNNSTDTGVSRKTELNLSNQNLTTVPAEIGKQQSLEILNLSNNKLTGIPAEIGQLKNLRVLNLSNNLLTGLPYELGNLQLLTLLDISGNNYSQADLEIIKSKLPTTTVIKLK